PGEFERSLADIPENLPTQPSNFNVEVKEPCVESGRARRKRKIPNGIGSLSECLCGENALAGESVVFCSNRGCETQVISKLRLAGGRARPVLHPQERKRDDDNGKVVPLR
ncbi:hypothetical protein H0H92_015286, partial [Tricholoma furcatifolium]